MTEKEKLVNLLLRGELEASNKGVFNCTPQGEFKAEIVADLLLQNGVSVIPIKHGKWIQTNVFECSECEYSFEPEGYLPFFNYRPCCGAKMDGCESEEESNDNAGSKSIP